MWMDNVRSLYLYKIFYIELADLKMMMGVGDEMKSIFDFDMNTFELKKFLFDGNIT